jgi:hypothetical protein
MFNITQTLHNEFIKYGWNLTSKDTNNFIYKRVESIKTKPYDEFIFSFNEKFNNIDVTVPIPFRDSSLYYKNTFKLDDMTNITDYIKIHLSNYL